MGEGGNCQDIAQKEYADYSDSQADICLQCYNTDVAKKREMKTKDHTGMYKQEGSL